MIFINNPFENPSLIPFLYRLAIVLLAAGLLIVLINIRNIRGTIRSSFWRRYQGWFLIGPPFVICFYMGGIPALLFVILVMFYAVKEYSTMLRLPRGYTRLVIFNGLISAGIAFVFPWLVKVLPFIYFFFIALFSVLKSKRGSGFANATYALFGSMWICYALVHIILFGQQVGGTNELIFLAICVIFADTLALFVGKASKKIGISHPFLPGISPNKTYAGVLGSFVGVSVALMTFGFLLPIQDSRAILIILIIGTCSVLGDLIESMIKRSAGVKDSSDAIPGHGGVLNRVNSFLVVLVIGYYIWLAMD